MSKNLHKSVFLFICYLNYWQYLEDCKLAQFGNLLKNIKKIDKNCENIVKKQNKAQ